MRRATAVGIMTAVLLVALHASAATLLFLDSDPGDYLGGGQSQLFTSPAGAFVMGTTYGNGVTFHVNTPGYTSWWDVSFFPPDGQTLAPGTYPDAGQTPYDVHPALYVSGDGRGCSGSGRFVVHEVRFAANGSVLAFAADFEEHCDGGTPALRGAVRFGSGNAACAAAADGAPCDDLNPCTTTSACQGNLCLGTDPLSSGCTTTDDCHAAGLCSPLTGACTSPEQPDGTTCTADACTSDPTCRAGICTGTPAACDDGNACTADRCDPAHGCVAEALSGC